MAFIKWMTLLLVVLGIWSCSTKRPEGQTEAEILYLEATEQFERGRYLLATERLNTLRSQHPYSYYATPAELMQADILFAQKNYVEAAAAYVLFRDFHPRHPRIDYVTYRIAESYYRQIPRTYDRDLSSAKQAINYYQELLRRFSDSDYTSQAQEKIDECKMMLQNRERYIADFYFRTKVYISARERYLFILNNYQDRALQDEAMIRIVRSSYYMEEKDECASFYRSFIGSISSENKRELERAAARCI